MSNGDFETAKFDISECNMSSTMVKVDASCDCNAYVLSMKCIQHKNEVLVAFLFEM